MKDVEKYISTKNLLDSISPSMCFAKWSQVSIKLGDGFTHSCHHPKTHKIPLSEVENNPSALHNTGYKKEVRRQMIEGVRPNECEYCWIAEDSTQDEDTFSDRIKKSSYDWSAALVDKIVADPLGNINPSFIELSFNNTCNLKCSYCGPQYSSKWAEEIKQHGGYPTSSNFNGIDVSKLVKQRDYNPYIEAFWKWWPELRKDLKILRITGGEPLLSKNTFDLIDMLIDDPKPDLELRINTNLNVPDDIIDKFIDKMQSVQVAKKRVFTSCEAYGEKAEYIRFGLNYQKWRRNCEKIIRSLPDCALQIMSAYNALCATSFDDFIEDLLSFKGRNNFYVDVAFVRDPYHQSIFILDDSFDRFFKDHIETFERHGFSAPETNNVKRLHDVYKNRNNYAGADLKKGRKDFVKFIDEHDRRRGTDFFTTFPEMEKFYISCMN